MKFNVFFRTSRGFGKNPIPHSSIITCYWSLRNSFAAEEIIIIADNADAMQTEWFLDKGHLVYTTSLGNAGSFRLQIKLAKKMHFADYYYFVENDHLHLPDQKRYLIEGLKEFDLVTLYDHPDKYTKQYSQLRSRIVATRAGYFRSIPSTVMTFALSRGTLEALQNIFLNSEYTSPNLDYPRDHELFKQITALGYTLGSCMPGRTTHCELTGLSPYVDWVSLAKEISKTC